MTDTMESLFLKDARPAQLRAVTADEPLIVTEAGAGTGKTRTLAWRYSWLVAAGKAVPQEIVTLTFTEKAAAEMESRIGDTLSAWRQTAAEAGLDDVAERIGSARGRLQDSFLGTIHSFGLELLRRSAVELGIDPRSRPPTAGEERLFRGMAEEALLARSAGGLRFFLSGGEREALDDLLGGETLRPLLERYKAEQLAEMAADAVSLYGSDGLTPDDLPADGGALARWEDGALQGILETERPFLKNLMFLWTLAFLPFAEEQIASSRQTNGTTEALTELAERWKGETDGQGERPFAFFEDLVACLKRCSGQAAVWKRLAKQFEELELYRTPKAYRDYVAGKDAWRLGLVRLAREGGDGETRPARLALTRLTALLWRAWEGFKAARGIVEFDDMIARALQALRGGGTPRGIRYVLVDEFQDTDVLQQRFVEELVRASGAALFVVGDPKQSIYRFRHADVSAFDSYVESAEKRRDAAVIALNESFRSTPRVLGEINDIFGLIWEEGLGRDLDLPYEPLVPPGMSEVDFLEGRFYAEPPDLTREPPPLVRILEIDDDGGAGAAEAARERLARRLGRHLEMARRNGYSWKDMAVLVPTRTYYDPLETVLQREMGLPVAFSANVGYFRREEVADVAALLQALADRGDSRALGAALSSIFSPLPLPETRTLLRARAEAGEDGDPPTLWNLLRAGHPDTAAWLDGLERKAHLEGAAAVVAGLLDDGTPLLHLAPGARRRAAANLRLCVDQLREFERSVSPSLQDAADYMARQVGTRGSRAEEAESLGGDEDAVKVMTIHAAKGLEYPVVCLFGLEQSKGGGNSGAPEVSRRFGPLPSKLPGFAGGKEPPDLNRLEKALEQTAELEEQQRLFYVACTRAKEHLVLAGTAKENKDGECKAQQGSYLEMLLPWFEQTDWELDDLVMRGPDAPEGMPPAAEAGPAAEPRAPEVAAAPVASPLEWISATAFALFRFCPLAYRLRYRRHLTLDWEWPDTVMREPGGARLGDLVHLLLSRRLGEYAGSVWDYSAESIERLFGRPDLADRLPEEYRPIWRGEAATIREWLHSLAASDLGRRLRAAGPQRLRREMPFRIPLEGAPRMEGYMDLFWRDEAGAHVLDFKTASPGGPAQSLLNREQLRFYAFAAQIGGEREPGESGGSDAAEAALCFLRSGGLEALDLPGALEGMPELLREVGLAAAQGPFEPNREHCAICPWRRICPAVE
ncbi:MAG: UvrD-helicase domain-containing protein [Synergistales bacterium]|nr:UvrD-helicase domain-containing protein [Synergistales bacterium]